MKKVSLPDLTGASLYKREEKDKSPIEVTRIVEKFGIPKKPQTSKRKQIVIKFSPNKYQ